MSNRTKGMQSNSDTSVSKRPRKSSPKKVSKSKENTELERKVNRPDNTRTCRRVIAYVAGLGWVSLPVTDEMIQQENEDDQEE